MNRIKNGLLVILLGVFSLSALAKDDNETDKKAISTITVNVEPQDFEADYPNVNEQQFAQLERVRNVQILITRADGSEEFVKVKDVDYSQNKESIFTLTNGETISLTFVRRGYSIERNIRSMDYVFKLVLTDEVSQSVYSARIELHGTVGRSKRDTTQVIRRKFDCLTSLDTARGK